MKQTLLPYYMSRAALSIAFGLLFLATGSSWWMALLIGGLLLALFIWAPHSGRYAVHPEFGMTAMRRDERTQVINDRAARNAFVVSMLLLGAAAVFSGASGAISLSLNIVRLVLLSGALTYFASDLWLRKTQQ